MSQIKKAMTEDELARLQERRRVAMHLQAIESNPLSSDDVAMFEMFDREAWPHDRRIAHIRDLAKARVMVPAAE